MRLATWNINSLRLRIDLLRRLMQKESPDVVCLQEIKVQDSEFPMDEVKALGFPHVLHHGMKGYNGVAVLSKLPLKIRDPQDWCKGFKNRQYSRDCPWGNRISWHSPRKSPAGNGRPRRNLSGRQCQISLRSQ